jgi:hypothetical protein
LASCAISVAIFADVAIKAAAVATPGPEVTCRSLSIETIELALSVGAHEVFDALGPNQPLAIPAAFLSETTLLFAKRVTRSFLGMIAQMTVTVREMLVKITESMVLMPVQPEMMNKQRVVKMAESVEVVPRQKPQTAVGVGKVIAEIIVVVVGPNP